MLSKKPSYEELEQRIREMENKTSPRDTDTGLRESRELLKKILLIQRDAVFILNSEIPPVIIDCNPAAENIFGYSRQEMLGKDTAFLHISKETHEEFQERLHLTATQPDPMYLNDFMMKRKTGALFPTEQTIVSLKKESTERTGWVIVVRDIAYQNRMEEDVRKSNERYHLLADNVSDVIFIRDLNLRFTYVSPSVEKMTGYTVEEAMALTLAETYTPRSIDLSMKTLIEEMAKEESGQSDPSRVRTLEMEGYRKDGSIIWTEARMRFLRDSNGRPTGMLGISRDITKRKKAETEIRISEERYRSVVEDMPALMCRVLPDGTLTFVNKSLCEYFDREKENLIGHNLFRFIPEEEREAVNSRLRCLTAESPVITYELQIIAPDGTRRWQRRSDRALFDESSNLKEYQCLAIDVTDHRRVEEALREKDAIFSAFLEHSPIYVFFKDKDLRSIHLSRNYEQLLGMPLDQVIGKTMDELFPSDLAKSMIADDKQVLNEGKRLDVVEELEGRIYETIKFPVLKDGVPFVLAGFTMDITARKQAEEALREGEEKYRTLFEGMAQGVFYQQADGSVTDVNPAALEIFGLTYEQFTRRNSFDPQWKVIHEDHSQFPGEEHPSMVAFRTGKPVRNVVAGVHNPQKNDFVWININAIPQFKSGEEKPYRVFVTVHDITAIKQTERELQQERDRARHYLDLAGVMFLAMNTEGNVTLVNRKACEILGYEETEILGKNWVEIFLPERWREEVRAVERELLAGGIENTEYFENPVSTRSGEERIVAWHNRILRDDHNNIIGLLCSGLDITERKRSMEALEEKEKALEIQTKNLEEVNTALKILLDHRETEKQEIRKDILSNLKNMVLPYLEKMGKSVLDPESRTYLGIIRSNLEELISPLLKTLQAGDSPLTPTELRIADFIRHGKTSKEISEFLGVSINAISVHRYNIRRRLGILNKKINLRSYLQNLSR
jgi:PAS domain S-box-containing protein